MDIKVIFFKESGKYYTEETVSLPSDVVEVFQVVDWLKANTHGYRGMYLVAMLDEMPNGYPILIPFDQRR